MIPVSGIMPNFNSLVKFVYGIWSPKYFAGNIKGITNTNNTDAKNKNSSISLIIFEKYAYSIMIKAIEVFINKSGEILKTKYGLLWVKGKISI